MSEYIDCILFYCKDIQIDDLTIGNGKMKMAYQVIPGVALGGVLGCQAGEDFDADGETQWYYHYNELGTVVATTGDDGAQLGVYMPDYFGNYRTVVGVRLDTLGLTGKFLDELLGLYYFGSRWDDPERGRWMSEDKLRATGPNLYKYSNNAPLMYVDPTGYAELSIADARYHGDFWGCVMDRLSYTCPSDLFDILAGSAMAGLELSGGINAIGSGISSVGAMGAEVGAAPVRRLQRILELDLDSS